MFEARLLQEESRRLKLIYIANARLPTEKAHGYQITKMCEAFSELGVEVLLLHPHRYQHNSPLRNKTVFEYYNVRPVFEVRTLANWDIVRLNSWLSYGVFAPLFLAHAILWGLYASRVAQREQGQLYYTRDSSVAYWLVRLGLPTVYEAHRVPRRGQRWLLKHIARHPSLSLVPVLTSFIKEQFVTLGFPEEKMLVSPDAVDLSLFENLPSKEECRRLLELPLQRPIVGYVGRFQTMGSEKGISELIESMVYLRSAGGKNPLLLCVGGPMSEVDSYLDTAYSMGVPRQMLKMMDRVPNSEVPRVIKACDVCTIPWPWTEFSAYYTSPLKLFEYMAAGVPIVASDLPSLKEILRHDENAWLVLPGEPAALAEGIKTLLTDQKRAQRLGQKACEEVKGYTWGTRAAQIVELIKENKGS